MLPFLFLWTVFLWVVHVKAKTNEQGKAECLALGRGPGMPRKTKVRTRCKGRDLDNEVRAQMVEALPHIVRAQVAKAKEGSLNHTKWLWGVVEDAMPKKGSEGARVKMTLAKLLKDELG